MITKGQYLDAVIIVEQYHKKLEGKIKGKTTLSQWFELNKHDMTTRLYNCLKRMRYKFGDSYMEDLKLNDFLATRYFGKKSLEELEAMWNYDT